MPIFAAVLRSSRRTTPISARVLCVFRRMTPIFARVPCTFRRTTPIPARVVCILRRVTTIFGRLMRISRPNMGVNPRFVAITAGETHSVRSTPPHRAARGGFQRAHGRA